MLVFPHAKINLGLHILRKRVDGYHDLETCFYPAFECSDVLEMLPADGEAELRILGMEWNEPKESNLVWKAMKAFQKEEPGFPDHSWYLLKKIPTGAGLGGGSSDAAFALRLMAQKAGWEPNDPRLHQLAAKLGSDCAFFLQDRPQWGTGRGEILTKAEVDLSGYRLKLDFPGVHVSTPLAFSRVTPKEPDLPLREVLNRPIREWKELLVNDFEASVFAHFPELAKRKQDLYDRGAVYASMSGSGSALFGLFPEKSSV